MSVNQVFEIVAFGIVDAAVLSVAAMAFTLQFGVTNYFNFGYGEWLTFGAYVALLTNVEVLHLNVWVAMLLGGLGTAVLSYALNRGVFAPFVRRRPEAFYILIVTFAMGFLLNELMVLFFGTAYHQLDTAESPMHELGPILLSTDQIAFLGIAVVLMGATHVLLNFTRLGRSMRATSDNRALAAICGIRIDRVADVTWMITGFMAGVAGVILAIETHTFTTDLGDKYTYLVFPAVIIGGIGRTYGALVGGLLIGLFTAVGVLVIPSAVSPLIVFGALVAIVLFRPQGLLGASGHGRMQEGQVL